MPTQSTSHGAGSDSLQSTAQHYDVVVIGGGFSGSSAALLLKRWLPNASVLVIEQSDVFQRKVGEATVEVSGIFLHQILGIYDHLAREHLPKHGLRYWFTDRSDRPLAEMTEIGSQESPRLPSFQLDRSKLERHLLSLVEAEGAEVLRPAKVKSMDDAWPENTLHLETHDGPRSVTCRWLIDASGRHAFIARRKRLRQRTESHPTAAVWGRWKGATDFDGVGVMGNTPGSSHLPQLSTSRRLATNHFCGYGWWAWAIPLSDGDTSVGVVYNKDIFQLPSGASVAEKYRAHVTSEAGLRELLQGAELDEDDVLAYSHLPYRTRQYMDRGWAIVGDAASFIDPYYSPGLDHASISVFATAKLLAQELDSSLDGEALTEAIAEHNGNFDRSYDRWLAALYQGKYELLGDAELTTAAFLFDTAMYYLGVVTPLTKNLEVMALPIFGPDIPQSKFAYRLMQTINGRLLKLARFRRQAGTYGRRNIGWRSYSKPFSVGALAAVSPICKAIRIWLRLEREQIFYRLKGGRVDVSQPVPLVAPR